jgi:WD40 repeat protein
MDAPPSSHPAPQVLDAFALGKLDERTAAAVGRHLESCPNCRRRVAELTSDTFLDHFRGAPARPDPHALDTTPPLPPLATAGTLPDGLANHPDYEVLRELGRGGMGVVYLARNRLMGRQEVLKVVGGHLVDRPGVMDRFLAEIRHAARLHHPNIVTAYSAGRLGAGLILAMEHVEGLDLAKIVQAKGPLPVGHACNYVRQAALGLQHAHEHGMVHRDIKPSNLMLARLGDRSVVKVLDFGLAKATREAPTGAALTQAGEFLGTPAFVAPEQTLDARRADIRADIYSLGCTLYYLLCGGPPFRGTSACQVLMAHQDQEARPLDRVRPEVPAELAGVVARMMAKQPERRYQAPRDVARALEPFAKGTGGSAEPSTMAMTPGPGPGRGREAPGAFSGSTQVTTDAGPGPSARRWAKSLPSAAGTGRRLPAWVWPAAAAAVLLVGTTLLWPAPSSRNKSETAGRRTDGAAADRTAGGARPEGPAGAKPGGPSGDSPDWVPLFNGKDLTGWKTHPSQTGRWRVEDGILVGGGSPSASHLYSERGDYRDFHLRIEARFNPDGNGGVFFRSTFGARDEPAGYEALINRTIGKERNRTGTLDPGDPDHDDVVRAGSVPRSIPPGQWFTLEVIAVGNILTILLDGKTTAYHVDPRRRHDRGHLALQQFDPQAVIEFRRVEIRELNRPEPKDPREIRRLGHGNRLSQAAFSPDASTILSGANSEEVWIPADGAEARWSHGNGNTVRLWSPWETETGRPVGAPMKGHGHPISALAYSPDGRSAATASHWWEETSKVVFVWDLATGRRIRQFSYGTTNKRNGAFDHAVSFSPDGRRVLAAYSNGTVRVWDLETEHRRPDIVLKGRKWGENDLPALAFTPDRRHLLSGNHHGVAELWDVEGGRHLRSFPGHTGPFRKLRSSADGRRILSADSSNTVRLWDISGELLWSFRGDERDLRCIAISPDGRLALSGGNDTFVRLWDLAGRREIGRLQGHSMGVTCADFSHDGRHAITGSDDGTIRLWALPEPAPG